MRPITIFYLVFLLAALLAPFFYFSNFSIFCFLQYGGLFGAGVILLVQMFRQRGRTRLIWLASVLIYPVVFFVTNPIFIGISCKKYISENEIELNAINAIVLKSPVLISVNNSHIGVPVDLPEATQEELKVLSSNLNLDVSGDENNVMFLFRSGEIMGFGPILFYNPGADEIEVFRLHHVTGNWYYQ